MAELVITVPENSPEASGLAALLYHTSTIYSRLYLIFHAEKFHKVVELSEKFSDPMSSVPSEDKLRVGSLQKVNSAELIFLGTQLAVTGTGIILGLLISLQKFYKLKAETEKTKAETEHVRAQTGKTKAETAKLIIEDIRKTLEYESPRVQIELLLEAASKLQPLGIELDISEVHRYDAEEKQLLDAQKRLAGTDKERKETVEKILESLKYLKEIEITKIKWFP